MTCLLLDSIIKGKNTGMISNVVLEEIQRAPADLKEKILEEVRKVPLEIISEDEASADLLEIYEKGSFIRRTARLDLRHLAVSVINGADAVVSWNFRDIVNVRKEGCALHKPEAGILFDRNCFTRGGDRI